MSRLINLTYHINKEESSVKFDQNNKLSVLKNLIQLTQRVNIDDFEILYGNRILSFKDNKFIKEIIGRDVNPIFHLIKIPIEHENVKKFSKGIVPIKNQTCVVSIENAPSRAEIYTILNKYLENKNSKQEFTAENKGSHIDICFKNPDIAYEFLKQINVEKINNPLYSKIKTNMILGDHINILGQNMQASQKIENKKLSLNNSISKELKNIPFLNSNSVSLNDNIKKRIKDRYPSHSIKLNDSTLIENILDKSFSLDKNIQCRDRSDSKKKKYTKGNEGLKMLKIANHLKEIDDENIKRRVLNQYYKNSATLRTGSQYISKDEIDYKEYIKNKKKWINEKGLLPVINKPKPNFIPNGINYEFPYGKPISDYQFREI